MNNGIESAKFTGRLAKNIILDMIKKDIESYDVEELPFDKENHKTRYVFTKEDINYDDI
jgi:hypothetical protein